MKNATTKRRLRTLIRFMENLPRTANKHFNMRWWFVHDGAHEHKIGKFIDRKALSHCGTQACALGWAATIPSLKKAGLKVETERQCANPTVRARRVFGINEDQFDSLFTIGTSWIGGRPMDDVNTPKQWAKKADALIREWSKQSSR